jgi:exosortase D (VPLPA-CTERM-specific)
MGNSVQVAPLSPAGERRFVSSMLGFQGWSLLLLFVWLYYSILYNLALQWIKDPNFQHGWFVPAFSLYVLWQERKRLKQIPAAPSWTGLLLVVFALVVLVLGILGVELFTSRASLLFLVAGLIILLQGWQFFRAILFPWAFLILMIPLPNLILQKFTFPLQLLASKLATGMLQVAGVPVLREGNMIVLAAMPLDVAEACSGIRSLLSLVTLAIIYGYLMEKRHWVRVALACAAVPIAVFANSFRIFVTGLLVQYWDPDKAEGFFHAFQGWLIFVVSLVLLFAVHQVINRIWKDSAGGKPEKVAGSQMSHPVAGGATAVAVTKTWSPQFLVAALLMLATAAGLQAHSQDEVMPPRKPLSALPMQFNGWSATDLTIDDQTREILGPGEFLLRDYESLAQPSEPVNLFIAYFPSQKAGDTIHSPNHCLPGNGWIPIVRQVVQLQAGDGTTFPANRFVVRQGGQRAIVLYWFQAHGRAVASEYSAKYYLIADSIKLHRSDGGMIRLMSLMPRGETPDEAQARVLKFGDQFVPLLGNYIPK